MRRSRRLGGLARVHRRLQLARSERGVATDLGAQLGQQLEAAVAHVLADFHRADPYSAIRADLTRKVRRKCKEGRALKLLLSRFNLAHSASV